jgi:hypothetical protein
MKTKLFTFFAAMLLTSAISLAQSKDPAREKLEKQRNDPKTIENAARADVRLIDLKKMTDSTTRITSCGTATNERCNKNTKKKRSRR